MALLLDGALPAFYKEITNLVAEYTDPSEITGVLVPEPVLVLDTEPVCLFALRALRSDPGLLVHKDGTLLTTICPRSGQVLRTVRCALPKLACATVGPSDMLITIHHRSAPLYVDNELVYNPQHCTWLLVTDTKTGAILHAHVIPSHVYSILYIPRHGLLIGCTQSGNCVSIGFPANTATRAASYGVTGEWDASWETAELTPFRNIPDQDLAKDLAYDAESDTLLAMCSARVDWDVEDEDKEEEDAIIHAFDFKANAWAKRTVFTYSAYDDIAGFFVRHRSLTLSRVQSMGFGLRLTSYIALFDRSLVCITHNDAGRGYLHQLPLADPTSVNTLPLEDVVKLDDSQGGPAFACDRGLVTVNIRREGDDVIYEVVIIE
jgi:hypothetical protein